MHWGVLVPTKITKREKDEDNMKMSKDTRDNLIACVFIEGANKKRFRKHLAET